MNGGETTREKRRRSLYLDLSLCLYLNEKQKEEAIIIIFFFFLSFFSAQSSCHLESSGCLCTRNSRRKRSSALINSPHAAVLQLSQEEEESKDRQPHPSIQNSIHPPIQQCLQTSISLFLIFDLSLYLWSAYLSFSYSIPFFLSFFLESLCILISWTCYLSVRREARSSRNEEREVRYFLSITRGRWWKEWTKNFSLPWSNEALPSTRTPRELSVATERTRKSQQRERASEQERKKENRRQRRRQKNKEREERERRKKDRKRVAFTCSPL